MTTKKNRPFVFLNLAMSADGKISTVHRRQTRISGNEDFDRVDSLRAECDAIMVGVGTVLADDHSLTVKFENRRLDRTKAGKDANPLRVVVDSRARTPVDAEILNKGKIAKEKFDARRKKAGKIIIISDMNVTKQENYLLSKKREVVEKMFGTYKTVLNADKLCLQNDESVFGHVFIAFISLYIHCKLELLLKNAKLNHKITPIDLLSKYSKVYHFVLAGHGMISEIPMKVKDLDETLGLHMFPKTVRC